MTRVHRSSVSTRPPLHAGQQILTAHIAHVQLKNKHCSSNPNCNNHNDNASNTSSKRSTPSNTSLHASDQSDVSELTGSYYHSSHHRRGGSRIGAGACNGRTIPRSIAPLAHDHANAGAYPWRQAFVLSSRPQPALEPGNSNTSNKSNQLSSFLNSNVAPKIMISSNHITGGCDVEVTNQEPREHNNQYCDTTASCSVISEDSSYYPIPNPEKQTRTPLIICLMHPSHKVYELLQLWVDVETDSVRDVLQCIQKQLLTQGKNWKQDYDGLVQVRGKKTVQLIHCLPLQQYDVEPYEVWMAKPWSMSVKLMTSYSDSCVAHLHKIGMMLKIGGSKLFSKGGRQQTALSLSLEARSRVFAPDGILKHYHAGQFLAFHPSMEPELNKSPNRNRKNQTSASVSDDEISHLSFPSNAGFSLSPVLEESVNTKSKTSTINGKHEISTQRPCNPQSNGGGQPVSPLFKGTFRKSDEATSRQSLGFNIDGTDKKKPKKYGQSVVRLKSLGNCFGKLNCSKRTLVCSSSKRNHPSSAHELGNSHGSTAFTPLSGSSTGSVLPSFLQIQEEDSDEEDTVVSQSERSADTFASLINRKSAGSEFPFPIEGRLRWV